MTALITPLEKWISAKIGLPALTPDSLRGYQLKKLREAVGYAKARGRFYSEYLRGFDDIVSFDDFKKLPFTTPDDIAQNPRDFLCVSLTDISRIVTLDTSGTTGRVKRVFFTEEDQELTIDFFRHGMATFTSPGDNTLIFLPGRSPGGVCDLLVQGLSRLGAAGRVFGPVSDFEDAGRALLEHDPDVIVGLPSQMYRLALETKGSFRLKSVLLASDYISPDHVGAIERSWECRVYTHYGMTETGFGGAVSCHANSGYHIREADLYFEIIDPKTGLELPDGEFGEIVFTTLNRGAMPLIRYRTGDMSQILEGPCPCGSILRRFGRIADRGVAKNF